MTWVETIHVFCFDFSLECTIFTILACEYSCLSLLLAGLAFLKREGLQFTVKNFPTGDENLSRIWSGGNMLIGQLVNLCEWKTVWYCRLKVDQHAMALCINCLIWIFLLYMIGRQKRDCCINNLMQVHKGCDTATIEDIHWICLCWFFDTCGDLLFYVKRWPTKFSVKKYEIKGNLEE